MESLEKWESTWSSATTDVVRLEVLDSLIILLQKILKNPSVTKDQQKEIYETIGIPFLKQAICSNSLDGISNVILRASLLKVLFIFSMYSPLTHTSVCSFIEPIIEVLSESIVLPKDETILEALNYLLYVVSEEQCKKYILAKNGFVVLCDLYCYCETGRQQTMDVLLCLMSSELEATSENQESFNELLAELSEQFNKDDTLIKFELCTQILTIILKCTSFSIQIETASKVRDTLTIILRNRIVNLHRHNAIKLAGFLIDKVGYPAFLTDTENAKNFFLVIVQLACVEIQMLLEDKSLSEVIGESFLLTACYTIFEYAIKVFVTGGLDVKRFDPLPLLNSIKEAMSVTLDFLRRAESELPNITFNFQDLNQSMLIVLCTIRVVCCWLTEETSALQEKVLDVLPFILKVCKEWFRCTDDVSNRVKVSPMYFFMAPLCHLVVDNKCREILLNNGLLKLLFEYFEKTWIECTDTQEYSLIEMLVTLCGIFLSIIVFQPDLAADSNEFFSFLKLLINGLPIVSSWSEHLVLKANFAVLGLIVTKRCHKKLKSCETSFYPFLSASIKFLWDAHYVEAQDVKLCLTRKYQIIWSDVMELWFLGIQALCSLLPIMPWIANFIAESGWPTVILSILSRVGISGIDGNIKSTYQALLSALVRSNDDVAETLVKAGGISISRKHHLDELERLLHHCANRKNLEFT